MVNNFNTVKNNLSSQKFHLVRIQSAREIGGDLTLDSGTTYLHTFHVSNIQKIVVDGTVYTKVSSSPSSEEYTFNESTKEITINLGTAYSSQQVVVFFYLFYTKDEARIAPETPTDTSSMDRNWEPRIARSPRTNVDFKNITDGQLQFGSSAITLFNQDHAFDQYIGDNDSFANKEIVVWTAIDNIENVKITFRGIITRLTVSDNVTIDFDSDFSLLDQTFFSNGSYLSSTFNTSKFPNMDRSKENTPIRKLYTKLTAYSVIEEDAAKSLYKLSPTRMLEAVCTVYDEEITTSNNRRWGTVLNTSGTINAQTVTPTAVNNSDPDYTLITYSGSPDINIGDTIEFAHATNPDENVYVFNVDTGNKQIRVTKNTNIDTSYFGALGSITVVITQGNTNYYPLFRRDYSLDAGQNDAIIVVFASNFEATLGMNTLDPNFDQVKFRARASSTVNTEHGDVMEEILETIGLTVNSDSITEANNTSLETNFTIPYINDPSFPTFGNIIESILKSTLGYITLNNDLEIEYALFDAPNPGVADTRTDDNIVRGSASFDIDYTKLYNSIIPINNHDRIDLDYTNIGYESSKATYLHEVKRQRELTHVLASPDRLQQNINLISERKLLINYEVKAIDLDTIVGDDFTLSGISLPGNKSSLDIKILETQKEPETVIITASDLLGL